MTTLSIASSAATCSAAQSAAGLPSISISVSASARPPRCAVCSASRTFAPDAAAVRQALRAEFAVGSDELLVLFVGSGFITKGLDRALLALAALPEALGRRCRFFVVGQDNPGRFQSLAGELGIAERVTFFAGRDDVTRFFLGADLLLHPAVMESGGIVLLEAAIAGLPVITTDTCGFAPYVEQAGAGVILPSPFRQAALNDVLERALADPASRRRWSANGLAFGASADIYDMPARAADVIEEGVGEPTVSA